MGALDCTILVASSFTCQQAQGRLELSIDVSLA
jgi:hypothetical protein